MLYEVYVQSHYIRPSPALYNFYWHSGGGAHHRIITTDPEPLLQQLAETALKYPNWQRTLQKKFSEITKDNSLKLLKSVTTVAELPREPSEFFNVIKEFIELDWREINNTIEVSSHVPGKIIGKRGKNIKEIRKHLNRDVKVTSALYFEIEGEKAVIYKEQLTWDTFRKHFGDPQKMGSQELKEKSRELREKLKILEIDASKAISVAFKLYNKIYNKKGSGIRSGWISPWRVNL